MHPDLGTNVDNYPAASQVSASDDPAARSMRKRVFWIIGYGVAIMMLLAGWRVIAMYRDPAMRILGGVLTMVGACAAFRVGWSFYRLVRSWNRYRRNRCIHCGYMIDPLLGVKCPECGKDPL